MNNSQTKNNEGFKMTGNWADQSRDLKSQFSQLTDEDLKVENGKENEMLNRVETRLNKNREEVVSIIQKGQKNHDGQKENDQKNHEAKKDQKDQNHDGQKNQKDQEGQRSAL